MKVYIGVDGGGTKTEVFALDVERQRGVTRRGPASNPNTVGWEAAVETVSTLIDAVIQAVGTTATDVAGISICLAGVNRQEQIRKLKSHFGTKFSSPCIEVTNDALAALTAGTSGESGVVLIAGTGSIAVGESTDGRWVRAGGYGYLIGDEGSGFAIGRAGLMAALQSQEGRGPQSVLWQRAKEQFSIVSPEDIIAKVYQAPQPVGAVASFARTVLEEAASDAVAARIAAEAIEAYGSLIDSVCTQLNGKLSNMVVLAGGILTHTPWLIEQLKCRLPLFEWVVQSAPSCAGAALRAVGLGETESWKTEYAKEQAIDAWKAAILRAEQGD